MLFVLVSGYFGYQQYQTNQLQTIKVTRGEIVSSVYASGRTNAEKEANLAFKSTGRIVYLPVKKNQEVKKWQVVATVDTSDLAANKNKELQDFLKTRWDFDQAQKDTYKDQVTTDTIKRAKEKAQFDLNKSVTDIEIADRALNNASLYSPFDGIVTAVNGQINEWVSAFSTTPLVTIIDPESIYFQAEVKEEDIGKIVVGKEAVLTLDAYPGRQFPGMIAEVDKKAIVKDNGDTVLPVKISLSSADREIVTGLNGDVQFILDRKQNVLLIPKRALGKKDGGRSVFVKNGFFLKEMKVTTGVSDAKNIEIVSGLSEANQIVLPGEFE